MIRYAVVVAALCAAEFASADTNLASAELLALKREQYRRILMPPHEPAFDPSGLLAYVDNPSTDLAGLVVVERVMDCRAALFCHADRLAHMPEDNPIVRKMIGTGYRAINGLDLTGAEAVTAALAHHFPDGDTRVPLTAHNPFSWLKNFTQWGYIKHPDGMTLYEPDPWNLTWQDGFTMNLAQDSRVVTARTSAGEPCYRETRYMAPMTGVSVVRDWISTRWQLPGRTVTFSVLTPLVDVDGVQTLTLSGFHSAPDRLAWSGTDGLWRTLLLSDGATFEPEVVASAILDFRNPPISKVKRSRGIQNIDGKSVARPWFLLSSDGKWTLILLPGARPTAAGWENGVFIMRFEKRTYVDILKAPANLHLHEYPEVAEFFAGVAAAYPRTCRESVDGVSAMWRYTHELRTNVWHTAPHEIAPIPPLADYAGCKASVVRTFKYPTKWNLMRYVEGREVQMKQPADLAYEKPCMRGVNIGISHHSDLTNHIAAGAAWVRLVLNSGRPLAWNLDELERHLKNQSFKTAKFLLDPHGLEYTVGWAKGLPGEDGEKKFIAMWDALSKIGARYPDRIAGYDLYNEPGIVDGSEYRWRQIMERAAKIILANHPNARIYVTGVYGGNPNGFFNMRPLADCANQSFTFHFYAPHAFTHQKSQTGQQNDPYVWYPGWQPQIDWSKGIHYGGTSVDWYDRWTLAALMMPAIERAAQDHVALHCGEFSVIGYANQAASRSAYIWTRDVVELLGHAEISWNIWNWGFGMSNRAVADYIRRRWQEAKRTEHNEFNGEGKRNTP